MAKEYPFPSLKGVMALLFAVFPVVGIAQTHVAKGEVSGVWSQSASPYMIDGTITIPKDSTLTIQSGTEVLFSGAYSIQVNGRIRALGEKKSPIILTYADTLNKGEKSGWRGIKLYGTASKKDTSRFVWCNIAYGNATNDKVEKCRGGAIFADTYPYLELTHCTFYNNKAVTGGAVYSRNSSLKIEGCRFKQNRSLTDGGALCLVRCKLTMINNAVLDNEARSFGGGLLVQDMKGFFANNVVVENTAKFGAGIAFMSDTSDFVNNTIAGNRSAVHGGGIHLEKSSPRFINSILWGNQSGNVPGQGYLFNHASPRFWFCDIQEGSHKMGVFSQKTSSIGEDYNNIDGNPDFTMTDTAFYGLGEGSPCIDDGISDTSSLYLPKTDVVYNNRVKGNVIDIGAYEFGATPPTADNKDKDRNKKDNDKPKLRLMAYPNPSEGEFQVLVSNQEHKSLTVHISSFSGEVLVEKPVDESDEVFILPVEIKGAPGIYLMDVMDEKNKVLVEKKMIITR